MPWNTISSNKASTALTFGGDLGNKISNLFNAVDIGATDATNNPKIRTQTRFVSSKLQLYGANETFLITFTTPSLTNNVTLTFPANLLTTQNNEVLFKDTQQTITGKTIDTGSNVLTNIADGNVSSTAAIAWSKVSKTLSKLEDIADVNITNRVTGSALNWNATTLRWEIYQPNPNPDINLPNKTTPPVASTAFVPIYRNDLDANNQRGYVSKIENGVTITVRLF